MSVEHPHKDSKTNVCILYLEGAEECGEGGNSGSCSKGIHGYPPFKDNSELKLYCCVKHANSTSLIFLSSLTQTKFPSKTALAK